MAVVSSCFETFSSFFLTGETFIAFWFDISLLYVRDSENNLRNASGSGDDVGSVYSLQIGLHMCYNGYYNEVQWCKLWQIFKNNLSSNCFLKGESMK